MNILIVGGGGREHALAWCLAKSPKVQKVYVAPGNGGTAIADNIINVPLQDHQALADFVVEQQIEFTVVGPEAPLANGIVDFFRAQGLKIFGPTQAAAQLESSKDFAKNFMQRHNIPTAAYQTFENAQLAHDYVDQQGAPIVIKADGLAAGKGVVVAQTLEQAHQAIDHMIGGGLGQAGARVVIEEFMDGDEASFIVLCDGKNVLPLATSQDHKRLKDQDLGPNTGGMGAYSPAPIVTPDIHARVMREIILPTIQGMARDGIQFTGFLYAGLMINQQGPRVVEFNCRMGDPETQPIMMRIKNDLVPVLEHAIAGTLDQAEIEWDRRTALGVVLAAHNYPDTPRTQDLIRGLPTDQDDCMVFHAGTVLDDKQLKTAGGRVLCVTALGDSVRMAQQRAYETVHKIQFDGMQYRSDIGWRAITRRVPS